MEPSANKRFAIDGSCTACPATIRAMDSLRESRRPALAADELSRAFCMNGPGQKIALPEFAAELLQVQQLRRGFDAFCENPFAQSAAELEDGFDNFVSFAVSTHFPHEGPVDLECIDGKAGEVTQR